MGRCRRPAGGVGRPAALAGAGRNRVQPHPRRRRSGLELSREGHHRHHPHPAHQRPGAAGPIRPAGCACTCPATGPGAPPGPSSSPPPAAHRQRADQTIARRGPTGDQQWKSRTDRLASHDHDHTLTISQTQADPTKINGGSGLRASPPREQGQASTPTRPGIQRSARLPALRGMCAARRPAEGRSPIVIRARRRPCQTISGMRRLAKTTSYSATSVISKS